MRKIKTALTIAGSDSGGGAGIEADIKTFSALGVHPLVAITAITAQNTKEVKSVHEVPAEIVYEQINAVFEDLGIDSAKTGMLLSSEIVRVISQFFRESEIPLVVDPVIRATSGRELLRKDAVEVLKKELFPLATLVTPNILEAEVLSGVRVKTLEDAKKAAERISRNTGARAVLVKGGHFSGEPKDVLYQNGELKTFSSSRLSGCTHGTGCTFSAAITAFLAKGFELSEAIDRAKDFIGVAIYHGKKIGHGECPVNPTSWLQIPAERWNIFEKLFKIKKILREKGISHFIIISKLPGYFREDLLEMEVSDDFFDLSLNSSLSTALASQKDFQFALLLKKGELNDKVRKKEFVKIYLFGLCYLALFGETIEEILSSL